MRESESRGELEARKAFEKLGSPSAIGLLQRELAGIIDRAIKLHEKADKDFARKNNR